jgi:diaminopimelate decarboxylase
MPGSRIVCNGAHKSQAWLSQAISDGAFIQVDHFDELDRIEDLVRERTGPPLAIGLRVNMQVPALSGGAWERFGFSLDSGEVLDAILRIAVNSSLRLSGLHCHLGTFISEPKAYREATARLCELFLAAESLCGYRLSSLNLGGGFPSSNVLTGTFNESDSEAEGPDITPFASAICEELSESLGDRLSGSLDEWPVLMLESGRHLVDDSGSLIATVVGRRTQAGASSTGTSSLGSRGLVLDAGLNILYTAHWYRHRVTPAQPVPGPIEETSLFGPLCMNIDTLRVGLPLPPLAPGHRVVIGPVGAYNVTQWMQFSQLRPAVVLIGSDGQVGLLRRAETIDDVKGQEPPLPPRYRPHPG